MRLCKQDNIVYKGQPAISANTYRATRCECIKAAFLLLWSAIWHKDTYLTTGRNF